MAKRKTPKTEKLVDLSQERPEKISENQLARLQATIKTIDQLTTDVGRMEVQKYSLMKAMENIQARIEAIRKEMQEEYGTDNINIQDGTIIYPEDLNPEENGEINKED
jgi:flagellar biosynthesis component FlhA